MSDRDKAHDAVNKAELVLDALYYKGKTYLGGLRRTVDKVANEREQRQSQPAQTAPPVAENDDWHPDVNTMLNDIASYSESVMREKKNSPNWQSGYRSMDRTRFENNGALRNQLVLAWRQVPEQFKSKRNVSTQPGPVGNSILDAIKDFGNKFDI